MEALAEALRLELYNFDIKVRVPRTILAERAVRVQVGQIRTVLKIYQSWIPDKVSILEPGNYLGGTQILNNKRVKELTDK